MQRLRLTLLCFLLTATLMAKIGIGVTPFSFLNLGVLDDSSLTIGPGSEESKDYSFTIPDDGRKFGYLPGAALELASSLGILQTAIQIGIISTPPKYYLPPFGARFYLGGRLLARLPLEEGVVDYEKNIRAATHFLVGLGANMMVGSAQTDISETQATHVSFDLDLLLGVSYTLQEQVEFYALAGPYIGVDFGFYRVTGYDKDFVLVPWGFILPQVGIRMWI